MTKKTRRPKPKPIERIETHERIETQKERSTRPNMSLVRSQMQYTSGSYFTTGVVDLQHSKVAIHHLVAAGSRWDGHCFKEIVHQKQKKRKLVPWVAVQEQLFNISEQSRRATCQQDPARASLHFFSMFLLGSSSACRRCFAPHLSYRCVSSLSLHSGEDDLRIPIKFRFITAKPLDFGQRRAARSIYNLTAASLCSNTPALLGQTTSGRERGKALLLAQPDHERKMICTSKESGGHCSQRGSLLAFLLGNLSKVAAYFDLQWGGGHIHHRLYLQIDYSMYSTQMFGVTLAILSRWPWRVRRSWAVASIL